MDFFKYLEYIPNTSYPLKSRPPNFIMPPLQLFPRPDYLRQLKEFQEKALVKVITGVRRCGKSSLMTLFQDSLRAEGVTDEQILALNFEDMSIRALLEPEALHDYLIAHLVKGKTTYIFLDEIQHVRDFARVIDSLYIREGIDLYITGSNANLLSTDIATLLTGRYVEIKMLPLSFREFVEATDPNAYLPLAYKNYLERSSFPYALQLETDHKVRTYLEGIYQTILLTDVVERYKIRDASVLRSVAAFLFDSIGSEISTHRVANTLSSTRSKTDVRTIDSYLSALVGCQLFFEAKRFDVKGNRLLTRLEKFYAVDLGLRRIVLGRSGTDVGHVLENIVFLELIRRGYDVCVGKYDNFEVDFIAKNDRVDTYIQVAATVREASTLERELRPLKAIRDSRPKLLLTLDDDPPMHFDGIWRLNALEWLMGRVPPDIV